MSKDYILLHNSRQCPACGVLGRFERNGICGNCGTRLFPNLESDFHSFNRDFAHFNFWAFDKERGWIHKDHLLLEQFRPQKRIINSPSIPRDYGRKTTPEQVRQRGGTITPSAKKDIISS